METKKKSSRGRPKKDYWELKSKIAQEAAENKWKLGRWRPKKQRNIDDSINTKISNHQKDVSVLEKKNKEIHEKIQANKVLENKKNLEIEWYEKNSEKYSKIALICSIIFCAFAIGYYFLSSHQQNSNNLKLSELDSSDTINIEEDATKIQVWYNDENWDFVEVENYEINNKVWDNDSWYASSDDKIIMQNEVDNSDVELIKLFYDKINNREFIELSKLTDRYLKNSDSYRTYFSSNWLNNFLDKIAGNKVFVWWFSEAISDKPNVKHYNYIVKYKLNNESDFRQENWKIAIVERNWEKLIWSIMCVTTWCSRMPFFQK